MAGNAYIEKIIDIRPIPGKDRIEEIITDNHSTFELKHIFHVGEKVIFVEAESIINTDGHKTLPNMYDHLWKYKFGGYKIDKRKNSDGIALPLYLDGFLMPLDKAALNGFPIGENISKYLGVVKYDPISSNEVPKEIYSLPEIQENIHIKKIRRALSNYSYSWETFEKLPKSIACKVNINGYDLGDNICKISGNGFHINEHLNGVDAIYIYNKRSKEPYKCFSNGRRSISGVVPLMGELIHAKGNLKGKLKEKHDESTVAVIAGTIVGPGIFGNPYKLSHLTYYISYVGFGPTYKSIKKNKFLKEVHSIVCNSPKECVKTLPEIEKVDLKKLGNEISGKDYILSKLTGNSLINPEIPVHGIEITTKNYSNRITFKKENNNA